MPPIQAICAQTINLKCIERELDGWFLKASDSIVTLSWPDYDDSPKFETLMPSGATLRMIWFEIT